MKKILGNENAIGTYADLLSPCSSVTSQTMARHFPISSSSCHLVEAAVLSLPFLITLINHNEIGPLLCSMHLLPLIFESITHRHRWLPSHSRASNQSDSPSSLIPTYKRVPTHPPTLSFISTHHQWLAFFPSLCSSSVSWQL